MPFERFSDSPSRVAASEGIHDPITGAREKPYEKLCDFFRHAGRVRQESMFAAILLIDVA